MVKTSFIAKAPVELAFSENMEQSAKPAETAKPKSRTILYVIILVVLVVVGAGVYILFQPKGTPAAGTTINIYDNGASCSSATQCGFNTSTNHNVSIAVHTSVAWINKGQAPHSATSCDSSHASAQGCPITNSGPTTWDTGIMNPGAAVSNAVTFDTPGTYYYYCTVHPFMHGAIIVT
jgi:plastocyanin